jgi:hypothetical protein
MKKFVDDPLLWTPQELRAANLESLQRTLLAPCLEGVRVLGRSAKEEAVPVQSRACVAFTVVVARGARLAPAGDDAGALHHVVNPGGLCVGGGFQYADTVP